MGARTGVLAEQLGMTRVYNDLGDHIPVTLLRIEECQIIALKTDESADGYSAVQLGVGKAKVKNVAKPQRGHFAKAKVAPKAKVAEFRVDSTEGLSVGQEIAASHYVEGQYVDVTGFSIGKGFAGGMKRHGFGGLEATHGVSISHRSHGSTGQCQDPGRVFKGKKMAGQMGDKRRTVQNLEVIKVDVENGLVAVKGAVPGSKGSYVLLRDAIKRALPANAPMPAGFKEDNKAQKNDKENQVDEHPAADESSNA